MWRLLFSCRRSVFGPALLAGAIRQCIAQTVFGSCLVPDPINWDPLGRLPGVEHIQCSGLLQYPDPYAVACRFPCMRRKMNPHEPTCRTTVKALQTRLPCFFEFHHMGWTTSNLVYITLPHVSLFTQEGGSFITSSDIYLSVPIGYWTIEPYT